MDRLVFVLEDLEEPICLGNLENIPDPWGGLQKLEITPPVAGAGQTRDQHSETGRVDGIDLGHRQQQLVMTLVELPTNILVHRCCTTSQRESAVELENSHITAIVYFDFHTHLDRQIGRETLSILGRIREQSSRGVSRQRGRLLPSPGTN